MARNSDESDVMYLKRGWYRRQYAGFLRGQRINAVSVQAEAWFWRINAAVDDFGNLDADPMLLFGATVGRRSDVTVEDVTRWVEELVGRDLLRRYDVDRDSFLHVVGFIELQTTANGKRVRRCPPSPWEASGCVQMNPDESKRAKKNENEEPEQREEKQKEKSSAPVSSFVLVFPCQGGDGGGSWGLPEAYVQSLQRDFPAVDVMAECRAALAKVEASPSERRPFGRMETFLRNWMQRASPGGRNGSAHASRPSRGQRVTAMLKEEC